MSNVHRFNIHKSYCIFLPNFCWSSFLQRGIQIYTFLLGDKDINEYIQKDKDLIISRWTSNTKNGGISLLYDYIKDQNLDENCQSFLLNKNVYCVDKYDREVEKEGGKRKGKRKGKKYTYKKNIHTKKFVLTAKNIN